MGLDSIELVMEFEKYFEIEIPDQEAVKMARVGDAVDYISSQVQLTGNRSMLKESLSNRLSAALQKITSNDSIVLDDKIFEVVPEKDTADWKKIAEETGLEMPELFVTGFFGSFIERIFPPKEDSHNVTINRFIDLVAAVNYKTIIDRHNLSGRYEILIAVMGITIDKIGISPFEIFEHSSFTKDLGVD